MMNIFIYLFITIFFTKRNIYSLVNDPNNKFEKGIINYIYIYLFIYFFNIIYSNILNLIKLLCSR